MVAVRRALVVANPAAKGGAKALAGISHVLAAHGIRAEVVTTRFAGHAATLVREQSPGCDAVFALGGDGTVTEVLQEATACGLPTGILPGGTGNLLARSLGIARRPEAALVQLLAGHERQVDLAAFSDGRVFSFAAGVGVDASMVEHASRRSKRALGVLAYVSSGMRAAFRFDRFRVNAEVDGVTHSFHATSVFVANFGDVFGGRIMLGPNISPEDGYLDLCVFNPVSALDALRIGWRAMRHQLTHGRGAYFLQGKRVRIETVPPRLVQADGDLVGTTPVEIHVRPRAARLLVPSGGA